MSTPVLSPRTTELLKALQWQGNRNDCGPYTTATVLNALCGLDLDAAKLAEEMAHVAWRGPLPVIRRVPKWATFPWGMVDVFQRHALRASWRVLAKPEYLTSRLPTQRVLMPIIGNWRPLWAHVMTLVAWDPEQGWGFANTQHPHHNIDWLPDELFQRRWRAMGRILIEVKRD